MESSSARGAVAFPGTPYPLAGCRLEIRPWVRDGRSGNCHGCHLALYCFTRALCRSTPIFIREVLLVAFLLVRIDFLDKTVVFDHQPSVFVDPPGPANVTHPIMQIFETRYDLDA